MGIDIRWGDAEQTVLLYTFGDTWTWDEYYAVTGTGRAMVESVDHRVVTIIDLSQSRALPPGALTHLRRGIDREHPNLGPVILVGLSRFVQAMANVLSKVYPKAAERVRFVATLDEAYAALAERQGT